MKHGDKYCGVKAKNNIKNDIACDITVDNCKPNANNTNIIECDGPPVEAKFHAAWLGDNRVSLQNLGTQKYCTGDNPVNCKASEVMFITVWLDIA